MNEPSIFVAIINGHAWRINERGAPIRMIERDVTDAQVQGGMIVVRKIVAGRPVTRIFTPTGVLSRQL
jgi:methyl coenzyme M reductase gamma subunit